MKNLFLFSIACALSVPGTAGAAESRTDSAAAMTMTSHCAISQTNGITAVDWSFGATNSQPVPTSSTRRGYQYYKAMSDMQVTITPAADGVVPTVTWHAIKTKGAGANDRQSSQPSVCEGVAVSSAAASDTSGAVAHQAATGISASCSVGRDANGETLTVHLIAPASSKVVVRDISFTRVSSDGGGMPVVKAMDGESTRCIDPNGEASDVAMRLLLPAVRR